IARTHFDYADISDLDRQMKRVIPFWMFMSRNLPLQMQQMVMRPRWYAAYNHAVQNFGEDADWLPQWTGQSRAVMAGNWGIIPDLQHMNLSADLQTLDPTDPMRMLSNFNPV